MSRGWVVTLAGTGINLALGILYTWSVVRGAIPKEWGWTDLEKQLPYAIACLVFSIMMVPAGRLQDKISPRWVASIGGLLVGIGMIVASVGGSNNLYYILGFGVLAGTGIGFGYASATPPAVKWFPAAAHRVDCRNRRFGLRLGVGVGREGHGFTDQERGRGASDDADSGGGLSDRRGSLGPVVANPAQGIRAAGQPTAGNCQGRKERRFFTAGDTQDVAILLDVVYVCLRRRRGADDH